MGTWKTVRIIKAAYDAMPENMMHSEKKAAAVKAAASVLSELAKLNEEYEFHLTDVIAELEVRIVAQASLLRGLEDAAEGKIRPLSWVTAHVELNEENEQQ